MRSRIWISKIVTSNFPTVPHSSSMMNPMRRFVTGGNAFMSLTSRARRSISPTNTSMTEAVRSWPRSSFSTRGNILVCRHQLAHADEGADNGNAHLHSAVAAQHRREHRDSLLRKHQRNVAQPHFRGRLGYHNL